MHSNTTLPQELADHASIPGIPDARYWGDEEPAFMKALMELPEEEFRQRFPSVTGVEHNYLAISGGAANGAFGAGFLAGWSEKGTRPEFTAVTGISTGALTAPYALLGAAYDEKLEEIFTTYSTRDLVRRRSPFSAVTSSSLLITEGLEATIARYVDRSMQEAIAATWLEKGRSLTIGTTNLQALRPVLWRMSHIAASDNSGVLALMRKVLLASSSIPIAFPPIPVTVEVDGRSYEEMHVDGGAAAQVFLYPPAVDWRKVSKKLNVKGRPNVYVIRNSRMAPDWEDTKPRLLPIALRTVSSLIRTQGIGDIFRVYLASQRDGLNFYMIHIPDDFDRRPKEQFDPVYMRELFELGRTLGRSDAPWKRRPPGF